MNGGQRRYLRMAAMVLILGMFSALCSACRTTAAKRLELRKKPPIIITLGRIIKLKTDGSVVAIDDKWRTVEYGQSEVSDWKDIVSIAADDFCTVGLKSDGTVIVAGHFDDEEKRELSEWRDIVDIAVINEGVVGLRADGQIVIAGDAGYLPHDEVLAWKNIIGIYGYGNKLAGLRADGTVLLAYASVEARVDKLDWTNIADIAIGDGHVVGLKSDGTVVAYSPAFPDSAACKVDEWRNIVAVAAGTGGTVGLKSDGTLEACGTVGVWGDEDIPPTHRIFSLKDIEAVSISSASVLIMLKNKRVGLYGGVISGSYDLEDFKKLQD